MKILVIGLGNPILGDDGVGWVIAQSVQDFLGTSNTHIEVDRLALGGLSLMERMEGYRQVILIDSLNTGQRPLGSVISFTLDELENPSYGHTTAAHDASLKSALEIGRKLGRVLPSDKDVSIIAVEANRVYEFQEQLSIPIAAAVPRAVNKVLERLKELGFESGKFDHRGTPND